MRLALCKVLGMQKRRAHIPTGREAHPLVLINHTPYKGVFLFCPAQEEAAQPQGSQAKSRTLYLPPATLSVTPDTGRAPAHSSQQHLPLNGQVRVFQKLPLGHLAALPLGSLG